MHQNHRYGTALENLAFYASPEHSCSYLQGRRARTLFGDPSVRLDRHAYSYLADHGFRRSGDYVYQPCCHACSACISVRIPVNDFQPRRADKRTWQRNQDLTVKPMEARYNEEHFELYCRYVRERHPGGGMDDPDPDQYVGFMTCGWMDAVLYEFRHGRQLVAAAVVDPLERGLSAVYTFYDPSLPLRSIGTYAILWEIQEARRLGLDWLYLGYWIRECDKMCYKARFRPLEAFWKGQWVRFGRDDDLNLGDPT